MAGRQDAVVAQLREHRDHVIGDHVGVDAVLLADDVDDVADRAHAVDRHPDRDRSSSEPVQPSGRVLEHHDVAAVDGDVRHDHVADAWHIQGLPAHGPSAPDSSASTISATERTSA